MANCYVSDPKSWGWRRRLVAGFALMLVCLGCALPAVARDATPPPNILLVILDDVGIDQMKVFGYGGATPPRTPNIDTIAKAGVRFRNFWTMPECSPSRAMLFEGRYPMRTNVYDAILSVDLANSQVSPYESTTPKLLKQAGYTNGLFGKFHLTGSNVNATASANNPYGYTAVHELGWDYFAGWQDGAPHPIDTTAGGVAAQNTYSCGFVPNTTDDPVNGADSGACYFTAQPCAPMSRSSLTPTPGRSCMERGGIFVPGAACQKTPPANVDFTLENGYYVGELVLNYSNGSQTGGATIFLPTDPSAVGRGYRSNIESQRAIDWIKAQPAAKPWMATVSYSSAHTPYQQAPDSLLPAASLPSSGLDCLAPGDQRVLSNQMTEAMDTAIGRVLTDTGIATRNADGTLDYDPQRSNTMIVILGDNGTYAPAVKAPFDPLRAKATIYQTGVWTPLIVAGPLVTAPGREVSAMVNVADVFELFGEMAGVDVHRAVPPSRPLDSKPMLPYLKNPQQPSLRTTSFTQTQPNLKPAGYIPPPCVIASVNTCVQLFASQQLCGSEGGVWWGQGNDGSAPVGAGAPQTDCCSVNKYVLTQNPSAQPYAVLPDWQMAMRDDTYKLVRSQTTDYDATTGACATTSSVELYAINDALPPKLRIDDSQSNLLAPGHTLDPAERDALLRLTRELDDLLATNVPCTGDGNLDGVVDQLDIDQFNYWANRTGSNSSWYDLNLDGYTNQYDVPYITGSQFPRQCAQVKPARLAGSAR